jgi:phosphoenolpyruvate carboxylase
MLSNMLAEVVKRECPNVYDLYTRFRKHGMDRASLASSDEDDHAESVASFEAMKTLARDISPRDARGVMKTFGIALNLVNAAEVHHKLRLVRTMNGGRGVPAAAAAAAAAAAGRVVGPLPMVEDSMCGTMEILLNGGGPSSSPPVHPERIFDRLMTQKCEIVLTAHPTEVNRKTLIRKCEFYFPSRTPVPFESSIVVVVGVVGG